MNFLLHGFNWKEMKHKKCKNWFCSNLYSDRAVILRITEVRHSQRGPARFPDTFGNLTRGDPSPGEQGAGRGSGGSKTDWGAGALVPSQN